MVVTKSLNRSAHSGRKNRAKIRSSLNVTKSEANAKPADHSDPVIEATPAVSSSIVSSPVVSTLPSRTMAQLRNATIAHPQQQCTLTCYIPPSKIGAVIGKKGSTVEKIQKEAIRKSWGHSGPVRVSVVSQGTADSSVKEKLDQPEENDTTSAQVPNDDSHLWTPVVIRGDPCACFAAAKLVVPLVSSKVPAAENETRSTEEVINNFKTATTALDYDPSDMDDVVLDVPILRSKHSAIIGRKGMTIAALSADHDVRIMVPHITSTATNINVIQLEGELEHVERCLAAIMLVVDSNDGAESSTREKDTKSTNATTLNQPKDDSDRSDLKIDGIVADIETAPVSTNIKSEVMENAPADEPKLVEKNQTNTNPKEEKETRQVFTRRHFSGRAARGRARERGGGGRDQDQVKK